MRSIWPGRLSSRCCCTSSRTPRVGLLLIKASPPHPLPHQMPIACVAKIMAKQLADVGYAKISNDAKRLVQECATEFICFIMSEANSQAREAGCTSLSGEQLIKACESMGAPGFTRPPLRRIMSNGRDVGVPAGLDEMVSPLRHALPHLQPPKRIRKKPAVNKEEDAQNEEEDAQNESKRRRVSKQASPENC